MSLVLCRVGSHADVSHGTMFAVMSCPFSGKAVVCRLCTSGARALANRRNHALSVCREAYLRMSDLRHETGARLCKALSCVCVQALELRPPSAGSTGDVLMWSVACRVRPIPRTLAGSGPAESGFGLLSVPLALLMHRSRALRSRAARPAPVRTVRLGSVSAQRAGGTDSSKRSSARPDPSRFSGTLPCGHEARFSGLLCRPPPQIESILVHLAGGASTGNGGYEERDASSTHPGHPGGARVRGWLS